MRRSRSALTAWPAFADLMTVLAVLGLATAAGVAIRSHAELDVLHERVEDLQAELDAARQDNARARDRVQALEKQLAAAQEHNQTLEALLAAARAGDPGAGDFAQALTEARARIAALETRIRLGSVPCLGTRPGSLTAPVPLLRIVVDDGYRLTRLWPEGAKVNGIPRLDEAIAHGVMQDADLQSYADDMYVYGDADETYDRPCRFWVELGIGESTSLAMFVRARDLVERYFLISNLPEMQRIIRILTE